MRQSALSCCLCLAIIGFFARAAICAEPFPGNGQRAGDAWQGTALEMRFRWCPAGKFLMGSPAKEPGRDSDEEQVAVTLTKGYWLAECELTRGQWQKLMDTTWQQQYEKRWQYDRIGEDAKAAPPPDKPELPMSYVNHDEATQYCERLTASERKPGRLPAGWRFVLPTEAQWEYACRAGTTTAWSCGDDAELVEKYASLDDELVVGRLLPNAWGLRDMHGNVEELVRDGYVRELPGGIDPFTPPKGRSASYRGGRHGWGAHQVRSADRKWTFFGRRLDDSGLRIAIVFGDEQPRAK